MSAPEREYTDFLQLATDVLQLQRTSKLSYVIEDDPMTLHLGFRASDGVLHHISLLNMKGSLYCKGTSDSLRAITYRSYVGSVEGRTILADAWSRGIEPVAVMPL